MFEAVHFLFIKVNSPPSPLFKRQCCKLTEKPLFDKPKETLTLNLSPKRRERSKAAIHASLKQTFQAGVVAEFVEV